MRPKNAQKKKNTDQSIAYGINLLIPSSTNNTQNTRKNGIIYET